MHVNPPPPPALTLVLQGYFTIKNCPSTTVAQVRPWLPRLEMLLFPCICSHPGTPTSPPQTAEFQTQFQVAVAAELGGMTADNVYIVSIDLDTDNGKVPKGSVWILTRSLI